jgi:transposase-like protein
VQSPDFAADDVKIIRCSYCGYENRKTLGWIHSHRTFQCAGCGDEFSLQNNKIRQALDAAATAFEDVRQNLRRIISKFLSFPRPGSTTPGS